jgi:hypothetical protein
LAYSLLNSRYFFNSFVFFTLRQEP